MCGIEGKIGAITHARITGIPVLGLCLGLQCIVIEAARNLAGISAANSTEFEPETTEPVISTMAEQRAAVAGKADLGGSMRLGAHPAVLQPGSLVAQIYGGTEVSERHRHRYDVNISYRDVLHAAGLHISGTSPSGAIVDFVEMDRDLHPFMVGTQPHPEFKFRPTRAHPLFGALIRAAIDHRDQPAPDGAQMSDRPLEVLSAN